MDRDHNMLLTDQTKYISNDNSKFSKERRWTILRGRS